MAKVLCISSQTVWGPVGNSAAVPALQSCGHEVLSLPTVVLSNHPGHATPIGQSIPAPLLDQMLEKLATLFALQNCAAVMTGYFASAEQVVVAAKHIRLMRQENPTLYVLIDPVIGDHGALYVSEDVAHAIREHLLPLATIITPNLFELSWLTRSHFATNTPEDAARKLAVPEVLVTSVPRGNDDLATLLVQGDNLTEHRTKHLASSSWHR